MTPEVSAPAPSENALRDGFLVGLLAILLHAWALSVPFQMDDGFGIPRAGAMLGLSDWPPFQSPEDDAMFAASSAPGDFRWDSGWYFRPTMWVAWHGLVLLGGGTAHPWLFHAFQLLVFGLGCTLLTILLHRGFGRGPALLAGMFMAVSHAAPQATTWASALGDTLAVTFAIAAGLPLARYLRTGGAGPFLNTVLLATLAQLSKDTAVAVFPMTFFVAITASPKSPRWKTALLALGLAFAVGLAARMAYTGRLTVNYMATLTPHEDFFRGWFSLALDVIAPWNRSPGVEGEAPIIARLGGFITWWSLATLAPLAMLAAARIRPAPWSFLPITWAIGTFAIAIAPSLLLPPTATSYNSRALHGGVMAFAVVVAAVARTLEINGSPRWLRRIAFVPMGILTLDASVHMFHAEWRGVHVLKKRAESLEIQTRDLPTKTLAIAVDGEDARDGFSLMGSMAGTFMKEPFVRPSRNVLSRRDVTSISWIPELARRWDSIRILTLVDDAFVPNGPDIVLDKSAIRLGIYDPEAHRFATLPAAKLQDPLVLRTPSRGTTAVMANGIHISFPLPKNTDAARDALVRLSFPPLENAPGVMLTYRFPRSRWTVDSQGIANIVMVSPTDKPVGAESTTRMNGSEALARRLMYVDGPDPAPAFLAVDLVDGRDDVVTRSDWIAFRGIFKH